MKKCNGNDYDIDYCRVEKMGCLGCYYFTDDGNKNIDKGGQINGNKSIFTQNKKERI